MHNRLGILALCLLTSCHVASERHISLASEPTAIDLGPSKDRPQFFIADQVEESALAELIPYHVVELSLNGTIGAERATHTAIYRLITNRPDAILTFPNPAQVTGVNNSLFFTPFLGMVSFASVTTRTPIVGYAMRAARCRLPFRHDHSTGFVRDIHDRASAPELLEGDTITMLGESQAQPPKAWPTWDFYPLWLSLRAGDSLDIQWIRPGKGKMRGTIQMLPPVQPHLAAADSINCKRMPTILRETHEDGRITWSMMDYWRWPRNR